MIEGLAASLAVARLREYGQDELADEVVAEFKRLQAEREHAREIAVNLEQVCAEHQLGLVP